MRGKPTSFLLVLVLLAAVTACGGTGGRGGPDAGHELDGPAFDRGIDGPGIDRGSAIDGSVMMPDGVAPDAGVSDAKARDTTPDSGSGHPVCDDHVPSTVNPGAPFDFIRPLAAPTMHTTSFRSLRPAQGGFVEALLKVDTCARLSAASLIDRPHRVAFDRSGHPAVVAPEPVYEELATQGAGLFARDADTNQVALFSTPTATAPAWTRRLRGTAHAVGSGGLIATLWNGNYVDDFVWDNLTITAGETNGYLVKADSSGTIEWSARVQDGSASVLAVDDGGTSVVRIARSSLVSTDPVLLDGVTIIPLGSDNLDCSIVHLDPDGAVNWIKRVVSCGDKTDFELSPTTHDVYLAARAALDWGLGPFSSASNAFALTKLDAATGNALWHRTAFSSAVLRPDVVVAASGVPVITGFLNGTITLGQTTISSNAGAGRFFAAYESNGDPRWLTGVTDCGSSGSLDTRTPLTRIHDKVAIGANMSRCDVQGHAIGQVINNVYVFTPNLFVLTP